MNGSWWYRLEHLDRLSDSRGIFEHAAGPARRESFGYCTDDNARLLVVLCREPDDGIARNLSEIALRFLLESQSDAGRCHNRLDYFGMWAWSDEAGTEDWWGRALWGLGCAAASHPRPWIREEARWGFERGARQRSPWRRSMAFAALGAADVLIADPTADLARNLLIDAVTLIGRPINSRWVWPEPRLSYANAALAEALIAAGVALGRQADVDRGLEMLEWLLNMQTHDGHLSVVGVGGRGPLDRCPQFDQQPIEVAALADACWRAWMATGDRRWAAGVADAAAWYLGANDVGVRMFDGATGGGYDGLTPDGPNMNQGAESTLAFVSTMQRCRSLMPLTSTGGRLRLKRTA